MKMSLRTMLVVAATLLAPLAVSAQSATAADAKPFLGAWTMMLDTPQGSLAMNLAVKEAEGKVTGEVGSELFPVQTITDVTKAGEGLLFKYTMDMQGQAIPVKITLTPAAEKMNFSMDFADGQFMLDGEATKG